MSNREDGHNCYTTGDAEARTWFDRQWAVWPERVDEKCTTNLSFLHGGVLAYRAEHGRDPGMSGMLRSNVEWLDRNGAKP